MKKLLLLLSVLLTGVSGAWATIYQVSKGSQVTDLATLSDANYYVLQNSGNSYYNYYDGTGSQMSAKTNIDYSTVVRLLYNQSTGVVNIQQVCTGTYYQGFSGETRLTLGASAVDYTFNTSGVDAGCFRFAINGYYLNRDAGTPPYPKALNTGYNGAYSQWKIYEVTLTVTEDDPTDLSFYLLNTAKGGGYVSTSHAYTTSTYDAIKFKVAQGTGDNAAYYTIYDCTAGKYVNFTGTANGTTNVLTNADAVGESSYWTITKQTASYYPGYNALTPKGGSGVSWNFFGGNKAGSIIGLWTSSENGYWKFVADVPEFGDYAYTLVNARNSLTAATAEATSITTIGEASLAYSASDGKQQFAFVYSSLGNCYLYNVGTTKFVNKNGSLSEYPSDAITFEQSGNWEYPWVIKFDDSHYINVDGSNNLVINNYGSGATYGNHDTEYDDGNMFKTPDRVSYDLTTAESKLVANVTYQIVYGGSNSISATVDGTEVGAALELPNVLKRGYIESYTFYSDAECTNEITTVPSGGNVTVYVNAVLSASCPITFSTEASPVWYVLQGRSYTLDAATVNRNLYVSGSNVAASLDNPITTAHQWAFIGNPFEFKIMNATQDGESNYYYIVPGKDGEGNFKNGATATVNTTGSTFGLYKNSAGASGHVSIALFDNDKQVVLNLTNGNANNMDAYVGTGATFSEGTTITNLSSAFFYPYEYYQKAITDYTNNVVFAKMQKAGTVGYPAEDADASEDLLATYVKIYGGQYDSETWEELKTNYAAYLVEDDIVLPTDGKVYKFTNVQKDGTTKFYLYDNEGQLDIATEEPTDGSNEFVCHVTNGKYAFISKKGYWFAGAMSYKSTVYNTLSKTYDTGNAATLSKYPSEAAANLQTSAELAFGKIDISIKRIADPGQGSIRQTCLLISNTGVWNGATSAWLTDGYSSMYELTEVDDYYNKVTLTSDGTDAYASLYLPFAVTIPDGITAYAVESQNGTSAHMEAIVTDGTLPAETGAILKKAGQTTTTDPIYLSPAEEAGSLSVTNLLAGTVAASESKPALGTTYVLGKIEGVIGLYAYTADKLAPGKAYLNVGAAVKGFTFSFGGETGLGSTEDVEETIDGPIYNLAGLRQEKLQKGVDLVNGKAIIVK